MRIVKEVSKQIIDKELDAIQCDCCKRTFEYFQQDENRVILDTPSQPDRIASDWEMQEFLCLRRTGGYGSIFGDMDTWTLDLCQECQKKLFGEFIKYEEDPYQLTWIEGDEPELDEEP